MSNANLQNIISQRPRGLALDIDGTLSPIAPTPDQAGLYPGIASLLQQAREYAHIAIMTGRAIDDGAAMVNVAGLTYIGSHGLEWSIGLPSSHPVHVTPEAMAYIQPGTILLDLAEQKLAPSLPGLIVERKRIGGSIHYRLCPDPEKAQHIILSLLEEPARKVNMRLAQGKQVIEVRTPLAVNKGQALLWFVSHFSLCSIIFAGDDRTDLDAVLEIARLRQQGLAALAIAVEHNDTPPALLEHADLVVQGVEGMAELLRQVVACMASDVSERSL